MVLSYISHTVIRFASISAKFAICIAVGLNGALAKFSTNWDETNYSA